ncbi:hypothetical protein DSM106972_087150 [Dulcicalothrix desertica PCC 7102]|uniref:Uncharacterized protein n=1 Tax=Dulcicalothrix desertica PCC 7102 TaxID=232991 RepID=A0A433URP9_9CYAN|nr:hypothetical protein [Dulcicalothrix desertica]RUS96528.1 hypothetical protein DSM106972_087150 [Dulcicalothrix desertica PCC 7102]TWH51373.1 hypothetical protein CAL7102_05780 [Dulcicalothrix desertica PCC 7102]
MKKLAILCSAIALTLIGNVATHAKVTSQPTVQQNSNIPTKVANPGMIIAQAGNLTGAWNCNDGGVYFIRQVGNQIWWYGQSSDGGQTWSNVFQGTITGSRIIGSWADVPKGSIRGYGEMTLRISGGRIQKISGGENFGGSVWSR